MLVLHIVCSPSNSPVYSATDIQMSTLPMDRGNSSQPFNIPPAHCSHIHDTFLPDGGSVAPPSESSGSFCAQNMSPASRDVGRDTDSDNNRSRGGHTGEYQCECTYKIKVEENVDYIAFKNYWAKDNKVV